MMWKVVAATTVVLVLCGSPLVVSGADSAPAPGNGPAMKRQAGFRTMAAEGQQRPVTFLCYMDRQVKECSGIVASRRYPGVFWVHGDNGNPPLIYAIDNRGKLLATYRVNEENRDWEDIAIDDEGHLFIADIGNNGSKRKHAFVYQIDEPDPRAAAGAGVQARRLEPSAQWRLEYPDDPFDSEAMFVCKGRGFIISKLFTGLNATIYAFDLSDTGKTKLKRVTGLPIHSPVTAADISADGSQLAVLSVTGLNVFTIGGEVEKAGKVEPRYISYLHASAEACCFVEGGVLVASEAGEMLMFRAPAKNE